MEMTLIGPCSGRNVSVFIVHKAGCRDIAKNKTDEKMAVDFSSKQEVVECMYEPMIEENENSWEDYLSDFHFCPCCGELK